MNHADSIKQGIRDVFGDVPFPEDRGIKAAIAMDSWISDAAQLRQITQAQDVKGSWWEIPSEEMKYISLASCYFDEKGTEFYLPAYMTTVLDDCRYAKYNCLISWLTPGVNDEDCALYDYFSNQFSKITGAKKTACIEVIKYVRANLESTDQYSENKINKLLVHKFWSGDC